jgi:hypothetical protein
MPKEKTVQISIRRLGAIPKDLPVFGRTFRWGNEFITVGSRTNSLSREARVHLLRPGMTTQQVLKIIGPPDYVKDHSPRHWEFDVDSTPPHTCRINWTNNLIKSVEMVTPPTWKEGETRDYYWLEINR